MVVEARRHTAVVKEPRPQPLDLPPAAVSSQRPAVLRRGFHPVRFVRRDHLDAEFGELSVQSIAVISAVTD
jgi:hypothetical protein